MVCNARNAQSLGCRKVAKGPQAGLRHSIPRVALERSLSTLKSTSGAETRHSTLDRLSICMSGSLNFVLRHLSMVWTRRCTDTDTGAVALAVSATTGRRKTCFCKLHGCMFLHVSQSSWLHAPRKKSPSDHEKPLQQNLSVFTIV